MKIRSVYRTLRKEVYLSGNTRIKPQHMVNCGDKEVSRQNQSRESQPFHLFSLSLTHLLTFDTKELFCVEKHEMTGGLSFSFDSFDIHLHSRGHCSGLKGTSDALENEVKVFSESEKRECV
jgi:hypothetical protein